MTEPAAVLAPRHGVLAVSGYGVRVVVERGHLCVEDGIGADRRWGRLSRVTPDLKRLVVLGHSGIISFEAVRWLHDVGAAFVQIDADGRVLMATGPAGLNDPRLRRAQALARHTSTGLAITRDLIGRKLAGQGAVLDRLPGALDAAGAVAAAREELARAHTTEQIRLLEAQAALAYWGAWERVAVRFARRDERRLPEHWQTFGARSSLLTGSSRKATNPANALLNYLYAILEAEARLAAVIVGCDPDLGVLHADLRSRDSLACDLMEAVRPAVDAFVLDVLAQRTFRRDEFFETRDGACRILPPLTRVLAETAPRWARALAPVAERVAQVLANEDPVRVSGQERSSWLSPPRARVRAPIRLPTPLTQANRSAGREALRRRQPAPTTADTSGLPQNCRTCGTALLLGRRAFCDSCTSTSSERMAKGREVLRQRRKDGTDPAHGGIAAQARAQKIAESHNAIVEWRRQHPTEAADLAVYSKEVLPRLQQAAVPALARATGLSYPCCALIRRGLRVPHPRHWAALTAAAAGSSAGAPR